MRPVYTATEDVLSASERFAEFSGVPRNKLADAPEELADPKQTLLNLVWKHAPARIKYDIVAYRTGGPRQGLSYNERLVDFVRTVWRPAKAAGRSDSLCRAMQRTRELADQELHL